MSSQISNAPPHRVAHAFRLVADVVLGIIVGGVLTIVVTDLLLIAEARSAYTTVNGWGMTMKAGRPGNSALLRFLMADELPAVNVAEESITPSEP